MTKARRFIIKTRDDLAALDLESLITRRETPSVEALRLILSADTERGTMTWKPRTPDLFLDRGKRDPGWMCNSWNSRCAGKPAGLVKSDHGYLLTRIFGRNYLTHRVIWAMHHGGWPENEIDHIDHDRTNNAIRNLRDVSRRVNMMNTSKPKTNTSGVVGVILDKSSGKWTARIKVRGESKHLGRFTTIEAAAAARKRAEQKYGFHKNHGAQHD